VLRGKAADVGRLKSLGPDPEEGVGVPPKSRGGEGAIRAKEGLFHGPLEGLDPLSSVQPMLKAVVGSAGMEAL
jgi:hypothetical protein